MARFVITHEIRIGDYVKFSQGRPGIDRRQLTGIVQDITEMPDIWVEGFDEGCYKRWRIGIDKLEVICSDNESGTYTECIYDKDEPVAFVHAGEFGTSEFSTLIYTRMPDKNDPNQLKLF